MAHLVIYIIILNSYNLKASTYNPGVSGCSVNSLTNFTETGKKLPNCKMRCRILQYESLRCLALRFVRDMPRHNFQNFGESFPLFD
jgi:hypothetical protein